MGDRQLSSKELTDLFALLISKVRERLLILGGDDADLLWALRRKLYKELSHDESGKPMHRRELKELKRAEQGNICPLCTTTLPEKYVVLDRLEAGRGYTPKNTRLLCSACDTTVQQSRGYK